MPFFGQATQHQRSTVWTKAPQQGEPKERNGPVKTIDRHNAVKQLCVAMLLANCEAFHSNSLKPIVTFSSNHFMQHQSENHAFVSVKFMIEKVDW